MSEDETPDIPEDGGTDAPDFDEPTVPTPPPLPEPVTVAFLKSILEGVPEDGVIAVVNRDGADCYVRHVGFMVQRFYEDNKEDEPPTIRVRFYPDHIPANRYYQ